MTKENAAKFFETLNSDNGVDVSDGRKIEDIVNQFGMENMVMGKWNEFMEKVMADEALQQELTEIIAEGGKKLTKEQKEKIAELAAKSGIELDLEGELSDEELADVVGGLGVSRSFLLRVNL